MGTSQGNSEEIGHSPEDRACPFRMAEDARVKPKAKGGVVKLVTYDGGHGWRGPIYPRIREGIVWLEQSADQIASRRQKRKTVVETPES